MIYYIALLVYGSLCVSDILGLDNGLARTPPMGFLTWERFECNTDCMDDPDNCIGERLIKTIGDAMVTQGFLEAGYEYVSIDDCWPADKRDSKGRLQPDPRRFPSGFKALADYLHARGLKFGIYEDVGRHTCAGAPGTLGHYEIDAQTFADWGIDMLKFDGCNIDSHGLDVGYPEMGHYLNKTGRPIMYSCEWPIYKQAKGHKANYTAVAETCNTFRVYGDIYDAWQSITSVVNYIGDDGFNFTEVSGPGRFSDADMVTIGNYGLSPDQERVQMGMWAIMASPILVSADMRVMNSRSKALLQNKRVIAISQDPLGIPGKRIIKIDKKGYLQVWRRSVSPKGSYAIAVIYIYGFGGPTKVSIKLSDMGLTDHHGYSVSEVFDGQHIADLKPTDTFYCKVNPTGIVLVKATPISQL